MKTLHEHEVLILAFLERYWKAHFRSPSMDDIKEALRLPSKDHVSRDLSMLQEKGYIARDARVSRSIRLLRRADGTPFDLAPVQEAPRVQRVPLVGMIAAGEPLHLPDPGPASYDYETILMAQEVVGKGATRELYALKVKGNSMVDALIGDGDIVVMERYDGRPYDGEIVAVWLKDKGETTLKRFHQEGERVRLQPCNPTMSAFYVDARNVEVQGKLVAVIRQVA